MSLVKASISWMRQSVAWSNSWISWQERLILLAFLAAAGGLGVLSASILFWQAAVLWAIYVVAFTVCSRQGWLQLFGPVLFYDMVRTARQSRYIVMRLLYASLLLAILCVIFNEFDTFDGGDRRRQTAILAETFFSIFMIVQLGAVILLTPAYVAGAIADEKDRKTLEFMLATDLNNHEIVLSKLLSRLANITLFLLTGLPILSILQFVGGVDTQLMLYGFAGTGLTMVGIASVSILFSTLFQKPRDAIGLTYLFIVAYGSLATLAKVMALSGVFFMKETIWFGNAGPTLADVSDWINTGNPISAIFDIGEAISRATLAAELPKLLTTYALFHGILSLVCIVWSIARLRVIALKQTVGGSTKKVRWWDPYRPPMGDLPMVWKELHIEGQSKYHWIAWCIVIVLVLLTLGSGLVVLVAFLWDFLFNVGERWWGLSSQMNWWFRIAGTALACLMLLMLAVRASTCISGERDRGTFDALITTPMSGESILAAKLIGCLTSLRMGWLWFGSMLAVALLTGGIHLLAVPIVIAAWFVYAIFFTMVGMWYSMVCQSSMRATVLTVLSVLFFCGGHWLLMGLCCYFPMVFSAHGGPGDFVEYLAKFQLAMTPPFVIGFCAYSWENLARDFTQRDFGAEMLVFCLIGLFLWAMACLILWYGLLIPKFREITRREELVYK